MSIGYLVLPFLIAIIYGVPLYFFLKKAKTRRQKIISLATPLIITLLVFAYGFIDDWMYEKKGKRYPEYSHITFKDSVTQVRNSIITLKSTLKKLPYWMEGRPILFENLLSGRFIGVDSLFYDKVAAAKNIRFLEANGISALELIDNSIFVTYCDSISKKEGLYYRLLQMNDISSDSSNFRINAFDTIDYKDGLYLLSKNPLN
jgi:hypothetical protein